MMGSNLIERRRAKLLKLLTGKPPRPGYTYAMTLREAGEILGVSQGIISNDHNNIKPQLEEWKSEHEDRALEVLSFTNMIHFYREELVQVLNGALASEVLEPRDRSILRKLGILKLRGGGRERGSRVYFVDWSVEAIMNRLKV